MKEDEFNWLSRREEQLPSPKELMPLSQPLISPDLALALNLNHSTPPHPASTPSILPHPSSSEFENFGGVWPARIFKRPRLVWTPKLHQRFVDAVSHLGLKHAEPITVMQLMDVDELSLNNIASHFQKYRLYVKRMQGHSNVADLGLSDPYTDHLFASSPVPPYFLHPENYVPLVAPPPSGRVIWVTHQQLQEFNQQRQVGNFVSPTNNGQFEHSFMVRQAQQPVHGMEAPPYGEDEYSGTENGGRKVLSLFPTGDD